MSGVAVITTLLSASVPVTAIVPSTRILAGVIPLSHALPAISVSQISSMPINGIRINEPGKMHIERIQVTAIFASVAVSPTTGYPALRALMKLLLAACPSQRGTVATFAVDSIIPEGEGPDIYNEKSLTYSCSRDFIVRYIT